MAVKFSHSFRFHLLNMKSELLTASTVVSAYIRAHTELVAFISSPSLPWTPFPRLRYFAIVV